MKQGLQGINIETKSIDVDGNSYSIECSGVWVGLQTHRCGFHMPHMSYAEKSAYNMF